MPEIVTRIYDEDDNFVGNIYTDLSIGDEISYSDSSGPITLKVVEKQYVNPTTNSVKCKIL